MSALTSSFFFGEIKQIILMANKLPADLYTSKPFPGSLTPGWNDPPCLNNVSQPTGRPRLNLNKRVAFPVNGTNGGIASESSSELTPSVHPDNNFPLPPILSTDPTSCVYPNQ
ncbi:uncharacterized protein LOC101461067 [Ceratitis capitata]|uniref:uncharacterized protein LOC101461067 n=1 Tax=Ceratitis capitata TaxID=7213 RepID=UPI000618842D|nr:uncharacterized protein LOC101461067 [Ceratitis capitata]